MSYRNKLVNFVMKRIEILDKELVNLIAAGEVVERPASVIKELMENSIDAQSSIITVHLEESGKKKISIRDNGNGIHPDDIPLAFMQHATSKIKSATDLNEIYSFGFRGEALASINAVSEEVMVQSKTKFDNPRLITFKSELSEEQTATRTDSGTEITIKNLFKRTPARLKFLKSDATELKQCIDTFIQVALPHTHIHFELYHNGQLVQRLSKTKSLEDRMFELWGKDIIQNSYKIETLEENSSKAVGMIGNTFSGKKRNPIQFIYLNNRYIQSKLISAAIKQAYVGFLHRDLQPAYVLLLTFAPDTIDVNVHPRKLEVKFDNEQSLFQYVYRIVRKTLEKETKTVSQDLQVDSFIAGLQNDVTTQPGRELSSYNRTDRNVESRPTSYTKERPASNRVNEALSFTKELLQSNDFQVQDTPRNSIDYKRVTPWQLFNTYILYEKENELIVIDQHAAAEKILFEKLLNSFGKVPTKPLLIPQILSYANENEKNLILEKKEEFRNVGIELDDFGKTDIQITEIPELISEKYIQSFITNVLNTSDENQDIKIQKNELEFYNISEDVYLRIATAACHGSIRAGQPLSRDEMSHIITQLPLISYPFNCPHGRPTYWKVSKYEFAKVFNRNL